MKKLIRYLVKRFYKGYHLHQNPVKKDGHELTMVKVGDEYIEV